jgi:hypothetical protein
MKIIRIITVLLAMVILYACTETAIMAEMQAPQDAPVSTDIYRTGGDLNMDFVIPKGGWDYTAVLSNDGLTFTLVVKNLDRPIDEFMKINIIRPILKIEKTQYPSGFKLVFHLSTTHLLSTSRSETGLHVRLTSTRPDTELLSMKTFGGWADPQTPAQTFQGVMQRGGETEVMFDNPVIYSQGTAGGRYYLDIFNVNLLPGTVKYKTLLASNNLNGKTRLIFSEPVSVCPEGNSLTIGKQCAGYSSMWGFRRDKNDKTESFQVSLPGRPEMTVRESDGLAAFGFDDTKLFSKVLQRFNDGDVYKVEVREKDGKLWLVFLYNGDLKYRKYYSGDKFFVVFYR